MMSKLVIISILVSFGSVQSVGEYLTIIYLTSDYALIFSDECGECISGTAKIFDAITNDHDLLEYFYEIDVGSICPSHKAFPLCQSQFPEVKNVWMALIKRVLNHEVAEEVCSTIEGACNVSWNLTDCPTNVDEILKPFFVNEEAKKYFEDALDAMYEDAEGGLEWHEEMKEFIEVGFAESIKVPTDRVCALIGA